MARAEKWRIVPYRHSETSIAFRIEEWRGSVAGWVLCLGVFSSLEDAVVYLRRTIEVNKGLNAEPTRYYDVNGNSITMSGG